MRSSYQAQATLGGLSLFIQMELYVYLGQDDIKFLIRKVTPKNHSL